ncbi:hypothetical protein [Kribbella antiqua]|uniref:hypothetical protein n=1 Tax=Kribbella antiqua TaxID=2512217 RepID=UPI0010472870|nr:hypothetical protein [Kribbella antiqua]
MASAVGLAGAVLQLGYGAAAIVFPYPAIAERGWELVWLAINIGMIAGVAGWLLLDVATPRRLARTGGGVAIAGYLIRIAVSIWLVADPSAYVDPAIVASIILMFTGMGIVGVCTARGPLTGWPAWAPLTTVAAGIVTATFYSIHKPTHFILLGLLWGTTWLALALTTRSLRTQTPHQQSVPAAN